MAGSIKIVASRRSVATVEDVIARLQDGSGFAAPNRVVKMSVGLVEAARKDVSHEAGYWAAVTGVEPGRARLVKRSGFPVTACRAGVRTGRRRRARDDAPN